MSAYDQLIQRLDEFIRKYYKNQLLKGLIYSVALGFTLFLAVSVAEYFSRFSTPVRAVLFFGFTAGILFILSRYIFIPLSKLFKMGKVISHEQAAEIVGIHFAEVKDKLINTLQLKKLSLENGGNEMLEAAIPQKTAELKPVPFVNAVNLGENKRYLKYAALPLAVFVFILFAAPSIITDGTKRVVNYNKEFKPEAPFAFNLSTNELVASENEDFQVNVSMTGKEIPQNVYIEYQGARFRMNADGKTKFSHTIKKVTKSFNFKLFADDFYSDDYSVSVVPKPTLAGLKIRLEYPSYLNKPAEVLTGTGDMTIPEGTRVNWTMNTRNTDELILILADTSAKLKPLENKVVFSQKVRKTLPYAITGKNSFMDKGDTNRYLITVIPDEYPSIAVEENQDSVYKTMYYFRGEIADDYGFKGISFHYKKQEPGDKDKETGFSVKPIGVAANQSRQAFFYSFNFAETDLNPGDEIVYFFTVYDNDGVNGSKSARTVKRVYRVPTLEELAKENERSSESIKSELTESIKQAEKIQKESTELNKSLLQKKNMDWQDRKKVEDILKKQKELEKQIQDLKKENEKKNQQQNQFKKPNEEELQKQKDMEKLLDEMMNEDLKKMLEELEKLMQQQDKNKIQEQLKEMKFDNEDLKKQLERTLELYKQMEFDMKMQETIDKLDKLAQEQKDMAKETAKENSAKDEKKQEQLEKKQEELNKKFDDIRKDMDDLQKKNEALENKREELKNTDAQEQDIQQDQQKSSDQMKQQQNKKASESQKSAGEKMEKMAQDMKDMQQQMEEEQNSEDLEALRRVLDNLVRLSFDQEDLMENLRKTNPNSPKYKELAQVQRKLKDDSKIIEDSLFALSKRVPEVKATVNKEIADIKRNMDDAVQNLSDRETPSALTRQQYSMTAINNLALMLSEAIENAQQQQMQMKAKGSKACKKPGSSGMPSPSEMKKLQEAQKQLSEQMKKMAQQMQGKEQGNKPGQQPGQQGQGGQQGQNGEMSKDFAKMAAEQEMIRKQMQEMMEKMGDNGQRKAMQDLMNRMEENETDLYNKRINQQTLMRQKDIEIKMLESEKAMREQEQDEQRESKEGNVQSPMNAEQYKQYLRLKEKQTELLRTVPPALKPYYKQKVSEYFNKM